ncbi:MAG: SEC-C metal-binding domain-containing protein [Thermotaleaceae bacterium]
MSERIDKKTQKKLLEALERAKNSTNQHREKREQRLWKEINIPSSLSEALGRLTKNDLDRIRKNYDFKNISALNKEAMKEKLGEGILHKFKEMIYTLDQERYELFCKAIKNNGFILEKNMNLAKLQSLIDSSLMFPGVYQNKKVLVVPVELMEIFKAIDEPSLKAIIERNNEWILLSQGMLYYYGVMGMNTMIDKINELTGKRVEIRLFLQVLSSAVGYHGQIRHYGLGYRYHGLIDSKKIEKEQQMRRNIDYYSFTKQQLLRAGVPGYMERTPVLNRLTQFLLNHYNMTDKEADEIASKCINIIQMNDNPTAVIQFLQSILEFPSFDRVQHLMALITDLSNSTRLWVLKGHMPNEIFKEEKQNLKPLPSKSFQNNKEQSNIIQIESGRKIGRNDTCPCGSGKKYKKCCGK